MSHVDTFWKFFWTIVGILALLYTIGFLGLIYFYNPAKTADAAAVGVIFDESKDPFQQGKNPADQRPPFTGEYFYNESLPVAFGDWSWGVRNDWTSSEATYEGSYSAKIRFLQQWAGSRIAASDIDISGYDGISLAVNPDSSVGDVYLTLFDTYGHELGRQSLAWHAPSGTLPANTWTVVRIPFSNLFPAGQKIRDITGLSIGSDNPGVAYIDSIRLEQNVPGRARWYEPVYVEPEVIPEKPVVPVDLPYEFEFSRTAPDTWRTVFGRFDITSNSARMGPSAQKTNGSMAYLAGGRGWIDYRVDTTMYWGQTSAFSILLRYVDDGNFVSCAFSHYNEIVQLYEVRDGVSSLIGTSPALPIRANEPWKDARASASVKGQKASCYVDGEIALSYDIPSMAPNGGIGLETWTQNTFDAPHTLQKLSAYPI